MAYFKALCPCSIQEESSMLITTDGGAPLNQLHLHASSYFVLWNHISAYLV